MAAATPSKDTRSASPAFEVLDTRVDADFRVTIDCFLKVDLTKECARSFPIEDMPLKGRWLCRVDTSGRLGTGTDCIDFVFVHGTLPACALGDLVVWEATMHTQLSDGTFLKIYSGTWPATPLPETLPKGRRTTTGFCFSVPRSFLAEAKTLSNGRYNPDEHRFYRVRFEISRTALAPAPEAQDRMDRTPKLNLSPLPYDVRIFFPNACKGGTELWVESDFLRESSPYFKVLLSSGFLETLTHDKKRPSTAQQPASAVADAGRLEDASDSDTELDEPYFKLNPPKRHEHEGDCAVEYKQITVPATPFSTYRAVLAYLRTGHIAFASLSSSCKPLNPSSEVSRAQTLARSVALGRACLVSPKSVFRLAHLWELDELQKRCLAFLSFDHRITNAAYELIDDAAIRFDAWRKVIIDFLVDLWDDVVETDAWKDVHAMIKRDEIPGAAPILLELMDAKDEAAKLPDRSTASDDSGDSCGPDE